MGTDSHSEPDVRHCPVTSMQKFLVLFQPTQRTVLRVTSGTNWAQELSLALKI